jgi:hypothetical protein
VKAAKFFLSKIIWIDMDPIKMKITMKKVAGFHSLDFTAFLSDLLKPDRSGFGTRLFQNEGSATVGIEVAYRDP